MDFPALAQQYGVALAALTVVGIALGLVARTLYREMQERTRRAEEQVDKLVPAIDRLSDSIDLSAEVSTRLLETFLVKEGAPARASRRRSLAKDYAEAEDERLKRANT
jgi:hypothetical protein